MEIAMRLQANHYTIVNSHNAVVHTVAPDTLKKLYKQQLRWTYGFINNALDYKHVFFKREYGNLGMYVLPMAGLSVGSGIYIILMTINRFLQLIGNQILKIQTIGFSWKSFNFDWFYINTEIVAVATILAFMGTISLLFIARKMADGKTTPGFDMVYYLAIYPFLAPLWLGKAVWNTIFSVKTTWR
jgi:cellulose synthase/poly-beta-1,6-N-acetylglucosamine synthase-like glycosyltransferase